MFDMVGSVPITHQTQPERQKDLDDIPSWLCNVKNGVDDPTVEFLHLLRLVEAQKGSLGGTVCTLVVLSLKNG